VIVNCSNFLGLASIPIRTRLAVHQSQKYARKHPMSNAKQKVTIQTLLAKKRERQRFAVLTCYDYSTAKIMQAAGLDAILVGDTYAEVCLGHPTTLPLSVDHLVTVTAAVRRGAPNVFLIGDMPYLSYQVSAEDAIRNAGRFMADAGCDCVKVEVDARLANVVEALSRVPIPVIAHLGLRPQSVHHLGGYRAQGTSAQSAKQIIDDAKLMEDCGASAILLEAVPSQVAKIITESTPLPVIGCVSGPHCDGQVVVMHDMLGYVAGHPPKSIKQYAGLHNTLLDAFSAYRDDVHQGQFPVTANSISLRENELARLNELLSNNTQQDDKRIDSHS
jgi:3-methyl-2-oxobutanoate hydroxymethyltransferase